MSGGDAAGYRALVCITTCERPAYLRRYLPHFARFCAADPRFSLLVSLDGGDEETRRLCDDWQIPLLHSEACEGVGLSKNRALERFPDFDHYFFVEDDVELVDGSVFPAHVDLARASGIHHFSLFSRRRIRDYEESVVAGRWLAHGFYGSASFNYFTAAGLRQVGGWHPRFAEYRRWGHTEHSYRFYRAKLAPAPFNVVEGLIDACIWHIPPSVTRPDRLPPVDADEISVPERELMDRELLHVPLTTLSAYSFNGAPFGELDRLAATLVGGERYPLAIDEELRRCRSDYQLWRYRTLGSRPRRAGAFLAAAWQWPGNPRLRQTVREAVGLFP